MTREFFKEFGVPEEAKITMQKEEEAIAKLLERPEGKCSPEMQEYLNEIDFKKLKQIFLDFAERCGIEEKDLNFLGEERIFGVSKNMYDGYFHERENIITLAEDKDNLNYSKLPQKEFDDRRKKSIIEKYGSMRLHFLARLIHEETHAVGKILCSGKMEETREDGVKNEWFLNKQIGYQREQTDEREMFQGRTFFNIFHALNEGVVEKLAREITLQYLKESDYPEDEVDIFEKNQNEHAYPEEVKLVSAIVRKLAKEIGQPEQVAWEPFVRGLFLGERFRDAKTEQLFNNIFGPGFLSDLSKISATMFMGNREKLEKLYSKYDLEI